MIKKYKYHHIKKTTPPLLGVTIVEALVAVIVFTLGLVGVSKLLAVSVRSSQSSESQGRMAMMVDDAMDRIGMLSYSANTIARDAFLDSANCNAYSINSQKNQCALGLASRLEWVATLNSNVPDIQSISVCRRASATDNNCSNSDNTKPIFLKIVWTQRLVGKGQTSGNNSVTNTYISQIDF
jgi:type IV pilus modification protein PilV